jgi:hypothetical protein
MSSPEINLRDAKLLQKFLEGVSPKELGEWCGIKTTTVYSALLNGARRIYHFHPYDYETPEGFFFIDYPDNNEARIRRGTTTEDLVKEIESEEGDRESTSRYSRHPYLKEQKFRYEFCNNLEEIKENIQFFLACLPSYTKHVFEKKKERDRILSIEYRHTVELPNGKFYGGENGDTSQANALRFTNEVEARAFIRQMVENYKAQFKIHTEHK